MGEGSGQRNGSFKRLARREATALSLAGLLVLLAAAVALAVTGDLTQPAGTAGCISETGAGPCDDGHGLGFPAGVAVSPDGKSIYVAGHDAVARLDRDTTTSAITQPAGTAGCISETGAGPCDDGHGLGGPLGVAVSPDGKSVYVTSGTASGAVARFNRDTTTGAITQPAGTAGCVSQSGAGPCADGHALNGASGVAVSPDGKSVYVASRNNKAVARFNRGPTAGAIAQPAGTAGCVSDGGSLGTCFKGHGLDGAASVAVSPDGKNVYVASRTSGSGAVARLNRETTAGAITQPAGTAGCVSDTGLGQCADGHGLFGAGGVAVSPDGKSVYVTSSTDISNAVARINRDTTTGAITQPAGTGGCVSEDGSDVCADGHGLEGVGGVAVSPDGKSVYVASFYSDAVARFDRGTAGAIVQPAGTAGCVSETGAGTCADGHALDSASAVAVSTDGKSVYVGSTLTPETNPHGAVARFIRAP